MRDLISLIESLQEDTERKKAPVSPIIDAPYKDATDDLAADIEFGDSTSKGELSAPQASAPAGSSQRPGTVARGPAQVRGGLDANHMRHLSDLMSNRDLAATEPAMVPAPVAAPTDGYTDPIPTTPDNLPAVISAAIARTDADPVGRPTFNPTWTQVRDLPGFMAQGIRALGRMVFGQFTDTPIEEVNVMAAPFVNEKRDLDMMAHWIRRYGVRDDEAELDFEGVMPGYGAKTQIWNAEGYTFMLVLDEMGQYIYSWPGGRGVHLNAPEAPAGYLSEENDFDFDDKEEADPLDGDGSPFAGMGESATVSEEILTEAHKFATLAGIGFKGKAASASPEAQQTAIDFATLAGIRR